MIFASFIILHIVVKVGGTRILWLTNLFANVNIKRSAKDQQKISNKRAEVVVK